MSFSFSKFFGVKSVDGSFSDGLIETSAHVLGHAIKGAVHLTSAHGNSLLNDVQSHILAQNSFRDSVKNWFKGTVQNGISKITETFSPAIKSLAVSVLAPRVDTAVDSLLEMSLPDEETFAAFNKSVGDGAEALAEKLINFRTYTPKYYSGSWEMIEADGFEMAKITGSYDYIDPSAV